MESSPRNCAHYSDIPGLVAGETSFDEAATYSFLGQVLVASGAQPDYHTSVTYMDFGNNAIPEGGEISLYAIGQA